MKDDSKIFTSTLNKIKESGMLGQTYRITFTDTFIEETINTLQKPFVLKREMTDQHIKQLFYAFLDKQDEIFKKVFLDIKDNNRIIYTDKLKNDTLGTMSDQSGYYEKGNAVLTINKQDHKILELLTFIHELAHAVDREKDKTRLTEEEFDKIWYNFKEVKTTNKKTKEKETHWIYQHNSNVEVPAEFAELQAINIWIEEKRIDSKLAKFLLRENGIYRIGEISLALLTTVPIKNVFNDTDYLTGLLDNYDIPDNILRFYAHSLSFYLANIQDKEKQQLLLHIFNRKKVNTEGKEMFDALNYNSDALKSTIKEYKIKTRKL